MKTFFLFLLLIPGQVFAQTMTATIVDISYDDDLTRIYLRNGAVLKTLQSFNQLQIGQTYKFSYKTDRITTLVSPINHQPHLSDTSQKLMNYPDIFQTYFPTIIPSQQRATELFNQLEHKNNNSECFNRAHVWSYSWRIQNQVYSSKAWIFFTRKYIRKHDFQWWFHVAPLMHIASGDSVIEKIADKKYSKKILSMKEWTDIFMKNDVECPLIDLYSEYANYPETGWCYTMKTNMYYYQPIDIETYERDGVERTKWNQLEIMIAYKDALEIDI